MSQPAVVNEARARRLRARRIRVDTLKLGSIRATAAHPALGVVEAQVDDLSLHGMALVLPWSASRAQLVLGGDRLDDVTVRCSGGIIYEGSATVRRVAESRGDLVIGVELDARGIDLGELYRRGARHSFAERWEGVHREACHPDISPAFKAWVADLHAYLEATRDFLCAEEKALETEDLLTRQMTLTQYLDEAAPEIVRRMNLASAELTRLVGNLTEDQHTHYRAFFRRHILTFFQCSPVLRRFYEKPLGHAGDYEMMNMLYRGPSAEGDTLFGKALNLYATQEAAARAVVNRAGYLRARMAQALATRSRGRVRIANIGCGPAREIADLLAERPELGPHLELALIDQEERSIAYCERTLAPLAARTGARVQFIREPLRRLLTASRLSQALGERDLIYTAGLFDYLNDRSFEALLAALYEALGEDGELVVGNFGDANASRWAMEYFCDWFLVHRSPDALRALASVLRPRPAQIELDAEELGINLFLLIHR